jgi:DNA-binding response OmpR family regulator
MNAESTGVLIVDDQEDVVEVYAMALSTEYTVEKAYDGDEALAALDDSIDVVILDRRMPGLSGQEVLAEIRNRNLDVRVAVVTAVDPDFDILEMDFDAYVTKPVEEDELRAVVSDLVELSTVDADLRELLSLAQRKTTLESEKPRAELAESDEYERLSEREAALQAQLGETIDAGDEVLFERLMQDLS